MRLIQANGGSISKRSKRLQKFLRSTSILLLLLFRSTSLMSSKGEKMRRDSLPGQRQLGLKFHIHREFK